MLLKSKKPKKGQLFGLSPHSHLQVRKNNPVRGKKPLDLEIALRCSSTCVEFERFSVRLTADQAPQNLTARTKDPVKPLWAKLRENLFAREKRHPLADFREKPIRYSPAQFL